MFIDLQTVLSIHYLGIQFKNSVRKDSQILSRAEGHIKIWAEIYRFSWKI